MGSQGGGNSVDNVFFFFSSFYSCGGSGPCRGERLYARLCVYKNTPSGCNPSFYRDVSRMQGYLTNKKEEKINKLCLVFIVKKE